MKKTKKERPTTVVISPLSEWTDFHGLQCMFGLRRSYAYHLDKVGSIKSVSLKEPGEKRGKRLFHIGSVRQFIESKLGN